MYKLYDHFVFTFQENQVYFSKINIEKYNFVSQHIIFVSLNMKNSNKTPVCIFLAKLFPFLEKSGVDPAPDSPASNEIKSFARSESIQTAFGQAAQSFIAATDYLDALDTLVHEGKFAIAPWSCARGMLESSAICVWLFETGIGPKERVSRSLSLRYAALREQQKMARYDVNNLKIKEIEDRIESIEKLSLSLGFQLLRDKRGRRKGIGQVKPNMTALIEKLFKGENLYRMLSGMTHSTYTTLTSLAFTKTDFEREKGAVIIRAVPTEMQSTLVLHAATIYAKCLWLRTIQFGFDAARAGVLLEEFYDELKLAATNKDRFWRTIISAGS